MCSACGPAAGPNQAPQTGPHIWGRARAPKREAGPQPGPRSRFGDRNAGRDLAGRGCPPTVGGHPLPAKTGVRFRSLFRDRGPEGGTSSVWGAARLPERGSASVGFVSARGGGQLQQHTRPEHLHAYRLRKSREVCQSTTNNHMSDLGVPEGRLLGNTQSHADASWRQAFQSRSAR